MKSNLWSELNSILYRKVPGEVAAEIHFLIEQIIADETAEIAEQSNNAHELMMQGEALRDNMKLHAILHGAYDHLVTAKAATCNINYAEGARCGRAKMHPGMCGQFPDSK